MHTRSLRDIYPRIPTMAGNESGGGRETCIPDWKILMLVTATPGGNASRVRQGGNWYNEDLSSQTLQTLRLPGTVGRGGGVEREKCTRRTSVRYLLWKPCANRL